MSGVQIASDPYDPCLPSYFPASAYATTLPLAPDRAFDIVFYLPNVFPPLIWPITSYKCHFYIQDIATGQNVTMAYIVE